VTVAALLLSPRRWWPALLATVGLVELGNDLRLGYPAVAALSWSLGNVVEPLLAAWLIQRWHADRFEDVVGLMRFALAAVGAPVLGGVVGAIGTTLAVNDLPYIVNAAQWAVGDGIGILTVVPFVLLLAGRLPVGRLASAEGVAVVAAVGAVTLLVFEGLLGPVSGAWLVLLPLVWAAVRLSVAGAAVGTFVVAQVANLYHALGDGPFATPGVPALQGTAELKLFLGSVTVAVLLLACRSVESEAYHDLADAREQLVSALSHELRTPLTAIVGFSATLVEHRGDDPLVRQAAEAVNRNGRHLAELVEELLRASRTRRGTLPVHPEPVPLATFLELLLADRAGQGIRLVGVPDDLVVTVDRTHLTQVVTNLLDNAVRHGSPPVEVSADVVDASAELSVTDHGGGVDESFVPHLFDEFAQDAAGDRRGSRGLGLGLPIARAVARANGGDVLHRPSPHGACFVLRLPVAVGDGVTEDVRAGGDTRAG